MCVCVCVCVCVYVCMYIHSAFNKFLDFFVQAFKLSQTLEKSVCYCYISYDQLWLTNFYDFRFKRTATSAIGIHPTKALESQLVNFKTAIWTSGHFRRTICNKILFWTWKKCHRNLWNATDCFSTILHESHKRFKEGRKSVRDDERCGRNKEVNTPELIGQRVRVRVTMLRF